MHPDLPDHPIHAASHRDPYPYYASLLARPDLFHDPHLRARDAFVEINHPELGPREFVGPPWKMSDYELEAQCAPLLGEHNDRVFRELLGIGDEELAKLRREGVVS
jgi:formyl-CoA transferase